MQVNPIQVRPADSSHVFFNLHRRTLAHMLWIAQEAARARDHRGDQHKVGGECSRMRLETEQQYPRRFLLTSTHRSHNFRSSAR